MKEGLIIILAFVVFSSGFCFGFWASKQEWRNIKQAMQHRIAQDSILILKTNDKIMDIKNNHIY